MHSKSRIIYSAFYGVLTFMVSLTVAWALMAKFDFFYGLWHDHGGIAQGIETYGPKNRYKVGFADTTRQQRIDIFHDISVAVHDGGRGLEEITYHSPSSGGEQKLLREPEVVHLQDVANLIDLLSIAVIFLLIVWPGVALYYFKKEGCLPKAKYQVLGLGALLVFLFVCLIVFGAENVFNMLHVWIFPDDHQWFFYYQESLMSTMMLAPLLFAWISGAWLLLSILVFALMTFALNKGAKLVVLKTTVKPSTSL